jgi:predicted DNA-binding transcriptional regulator AlpA
MRSGGTVAETVKETTMAEASTSPAFEQHYKAQYLAKLWNISYETVLRRAKDFPGVIRLGNPNSRKRTRVVISIPHSVAEQLHAELTGNSTWRLLDLGSSGKARRSVHRP